MSILIKCMKKPQRCAGCYMFLNGLDMDGTPWQECAAIDRDPGDPFGSCMPDWCPISKLPVPHGRLIDADALVKEVEDIAKEFPSDSIGAERFKLFAKFITEMPTIIQASEEGET